MRKPMTEHDTTDHVNAIRNIASYVGAHFDGVSQDRLEHHADALAAQLAAAEARCQRLQEAYLDAENDSVNHALPAHNEEHNDNVSRREWIQTLRDAHLEDGDLPESEADR